MTDIVVFWLLFFAVGIGWFLGRRSFNAPSIRSELPSQYYRGLNFLLDGRPDVAVDAFIYRAKFVPTVFSARQFINHGHIKVNGKRVNIPSYRLKTGDLVEIKDKSKSLDLVLNGQESAERDVPDYIECDQKKLTAKLTRVPKLEEVPYPVQMEPNLVVEFYSRN